MPRLRFLGENKVQEAYRKWETMSDLVDLQWSIIGHLQTNKAKLVARFASEFQALDSLRVAEELDRRLQAEGRAMDVFVQVNTSGEASKFGLEPDAVAGFLRGMPGFLGAAGAWLDDPGLVLRRPRACANVSSCCAACVTGCGRKRISASA